EPFVYKLVESVAKVMSGEFPELRDKQSHVERVVKAEEEGFNATLDRGLEIFESVVSKIDIRRHRTFPGHEAFRLYDTYGFPIDLTQLMAEERGLKVDTAEFSKLMEQQRQRAREAGRNLYISVHENVSVSESVRAIVVRKLDLSQLPKSSDFVGHHTLEKDAEVLRFESQREKGFVVLSATPFYVKSGGQVDDTGIIRLVGKNLPVVAMDKREEHIIHVVENPDNLQLVEGQNVRAIVDKPRRLAIMRNHTTTHLVHEALRRVLGSHVHQQGSLVAPNKLRFDFPHFAKITAEELRAIEQMVNEKIQEGIDIYTETLPIEKARKIPGVKMFFGDKYGEVVRVVFVDERFSVEFCGGTHVKNSKEIGLFKITSESSIASGVRRIEAVTGEGISRYIEDRVHRVDLLDEQLARLVDEQESLEKELSKFKKVKPPSRPSLGVISLDTKRSRHDEFRSAEEALDTVEKAIQQREESSKRISAETQRLRKELSKYRVREVGSQIDVLIGNASTVNGFKVVSGRIDAGNMEELKTLADRLRTRLGSGVGVLGAVVGDKAAFVCVVTDDLIEKKKLQAGKIVGELAKRVGGGGGGRPHLATAGGKYVQNLDAALENTVSVVKSFLKG
ncbi:MAG: alanine--tRNA ligase-related protein, partial [Bacteroidota bacterium]